MLWVDHRLSWDPSDYGGIQRITVASNTVWMPDIVLSAVGSGKSLDTDILNRVVVFGNGEVLMTPVKDVDIICDIDATNYPFDEQMCSFMFSTWYVAK